MQSTVGKARVPMRSVSPLHRPGRQRYRGQRDRAKVEDATATRSGA